jgi:hypothetical protein
VQEKDEVELKPTDSQTTAGAVGPIVPHGRAQVRWSRSAIGWFISRTIYLCTELAFVVVKLM